MNPLEQARLPIRYSSQPFKATRKSVPRVRTGCFSCKTRRTKCDEKKPSCSRCLTANRPCEYPPAKAQRDRTRIPKDTRPIVPKAKPAQMISFIRLPPEYRFENETEHRYFQRFCEKTIFDLAGFEETDVWSSLVLQACEWRPSIRNAVIAIGALDQTLEAARAGEGVSSHHYFALQQYDKSVRRMREDVGKSTQDLKIIIISCLLLVAFELFHGNHNSALKQASTGLNLIMDRIRKANSETGGPKSKARTLFNDVDEALIQKFIRLDLSSMSFVDESVIIQAHTARSEVIEHYETIPEKFASLAEAQQYWELSMRRIMNFMTVASKWEYVSNSEPPEDPIATWEKHNEPASTRITETRDDGFVHRTSSEPEDPPNAYKSLDRLLQWHEAFQPLFMHSRTPEGKADFMRATMLELRFKTNMIPMSSSRFEGELQYDNPKIFSYFKDIVSLSKIVMNYDPNRTTQTPEDDRSSALPSKASFTFDTGTIGPLYVVASKCRNPALRREAIAVLHAKPRRECVWDNVVAATFASTIMEMEERGLEGNFVPESWRVKSEGMSFDLLLRRGRLRYSSGERQPREGRFVRSVPVSW